MTTTIGCLVQAKYIETSQTTQYTAGAGTLVVIDKATLHNASATPASATLNVVASGGTASGANRVLSRVLAAGGYDLCPELVGQVLAAGDFVSAISGTVSAIVLRCSGRVVTT